MFSFCVFRRDSIGRSEGLRLVHKAIVFASHEQLMMALRLLLHRSPGLKSVEITAYFSDASVEKVINGERRISGSFNQLESSGISNSTIALSNHATEYPSPFRRTKSYTQKSFAGIVGLNSYSTDSLAAGPGSNRVSFPDMEHL